MPQLREADENQNQSGYGFEEVPSFLPLVQGTEHRRNERKGRKLTTVQQVFDIAIHMMDEQSESSGSTTTTDTQEYKLRTLSILNATLPALYPYSDTYDHAAAGRPACPVLDQANHANPDFTQAIPLDDTLALGVLPYALASHLLSGENEELAAWFMARYNQSFADLRYKLPASFEPISAPYGLF